MARPRKPSNVLHLTGAFKHDPKRGADRQNEPQPTDEIGDPPDWFDPFQNACWREICALAHPGTLSQADRLIVEHGAQLLCQLRIAGWEVHPTLLIRWESFLGKLGLTPADRSKVQVAKPKEDANPFAKFKPAG